MIAYIGIFFGNSALLLRQYAEYSLISALPKVNFQLMIVWYAVTVGILCYLGIEAICRTGYIMLPLLVSGLMLVFVSVSPFYMVYNLMPWQGNGIMPAIHAGIHGVGFGVGIIALAVLSSAFQNAKTIKSIAMYVTGGVVVLRIMFILSYTMVFGIGAGTEKVMPLFELTRLVYLNQYVQRIEALFIVVWVIIGLLSITVFLYIGLYLIVMLLKLPTLRPIVPLGVIIVADLAMLPSNIGYTVQLDKWMLQIAEIGIYVIPGILFIMTLVKKRRKKTCPSA